MPCDRNWDSHHCIKTDQPPLHHGNTSTVLVDNLKQTLQFRIYLI